MRFRRSVLGAVMLCLTAGPTLGASEADWETCKGSDAKQAIAACTRIVQNKGETAKDRAQAFLFRGMAFSKSNNNDNALRDFNEALKLDATLAAAYLERGRIYQNRRDYKRAIVDYGKAIELDPDSAAAYANRGACYKALGELDLARVDLDEAIRLIPDFAYARFHRGVVHRLRGASDVAIADFNVAARSDRFGGNGNFYSNRGFAYFLNGEQARAISDFGVAMWFREKDAEYYRGAAHYAAGDYHAAESDFKLSWRRGRYYIVGVYQYLAAARSGNALDAGPLLARFVTQISPGWNLQLANFYLGTVDMETLLKTAKTDGQKCQALYHASAWLLLRNNRESAAPLLEAAASDACKETYPEYSWANFELALVRRSTRRDD